jgi:hypothetical protein
MLLVIVRQHIRRPAERRYRVRMSFRPALILK